MRTSQKTPEIISTIGIDVGKAISVGSHSLSVQAGAYYNVKKPDQASEWELRAQLSWIF